MGVGYLDIVDVLSIILILISCIILIPILVYSLYRFHNITDTQLVKHRNPHIVYAINLLTIFCFLSERIFAISTEVIYHSDHPLPIWTVSLCDNFTVVIVYVLCVIRTWLLYYNRKYYTKIAENVWKKDINSNEVSWFIRNRNKYGSFRSIFIRIAFIPSVTFICIEISADIIFGGEGIHDHILNILLPLSLFIIFLYLYYKIKDFYDAFNVRKEIYYQCIALCVVICIEAIDVIAFFVTDAVQNHNDYHYLERVEWLISAIVTYFSLFILSLISTAYPVWLNMERSQQKELGKSQLNHQNNSSSMLDSIATIDGYKSFITQLVNHFATENLLFITELIQIKHNLQMEHNNIITALKTSESALLTGKDLAPNVEFADAVCITIDFNENKETAQDDSESDALQIYKVGGGIEGGVTFSGIFNDNNHLLCKINLPLKLPHSKILDEHNNFIAQMHCLFNKYVDVGSEYEINISGEERSLLMKIFANIENIQCKENYLFNIMDAACIEILGLCYSSYVKFTD